MPNISSCRDELMLILEDIKTRAMLYQQFPPSYVEGNDEFYSKSKMMFAIGLNDYHPIQFRCVSGSKLVRINPWVFSEKDNDDCVLLTS